jgi:hypothetical protein
MSRSVIVLPSFSAKPILDAIANAIRMPKKILPLTQANIRSTIKRKEL